MDFQFFVFDDRYSVPTFQLVQADGEAHARQLAQALLANNPHHVGVEVCMEGQRLFVVGVIGGTSEPA